MSSQIEELESLLFDWEAGTLNNEGMARIQDILSQDESARKFFLQQQIMSAALKLEGDAGLIRPAVEDSTNDTVQRVKPVRHSATSAFRFNYWIVATAMLLICALIGRIVYLEFSPDSNQRVSVTADSNSQPQREEATSRGVAIITRLMDVTWDDGQAAIEVGDALPPGRLAIQSGFAQVEFFCGATLIIEGPADLEIESETLARVHNGRLRAQVPPAARGFSLEVDDMKVVDLGTEFGLSVSEEGADVQVFDGEVELQENNQKQLLTAGQALVRNPTGIFEKSEMTPERYLDIAALESRAQGRRTARYEQWKAWSEKLRNDPRLITYFAFDQNGGWERRLKCDVLPKNSELDGAIVGARSVPGRWKMKRALEFKQPGDRVRVQIPGEFSSLTFACWARIDSLDRWYNSLFLTDNYNQGEPHWQILDTGQIYFSVRPSKRGTQGAPDRKVLSPPFWKPSLSGKWLHLATTYDVDAQRTTHYLNGKVLYSESIPDSQLVKTTRIGAATIGNWSMSTKPDARFAIRNLNGRIDELAIFAAALTADEIKEIYDNGKP